MMILNIETGKKYILPTIAKTRRGICYYHIMNVWKNMVQIIKLKKHTGRSSIYNRKGLYSEDRYVPELEIIMKKYPNAILTLNSAFYYYGLTDTIPDHYYVATPKSNRKIEDVRVKL